MIWQGYVIWTSLVYLEYINGYQVTRTWKEWRLQGKLEKAWILELDSYKGKFQPPTISSYTSLRELTFRFI